MENEKRVIKGEINSYNLIQMLTNVIFDEKADSDIKSEIAERVDNISDLNANGENINDYDEFIYDILTSVETLKYLIEVKNGYYVIKDLRIKIKTNIILTKEEIETLFNTENIFNYNYGSFSYQKIKINQVLKEYNEILNIPCIGKVQEKTKEEGSRELPPLKENNEITKVVFRKYKGGEIIACFPQSGNITTYKIEAYVHQGQHINVSWGEIVDNSKLAKECEYNALKNELENLGYNLKVMKKANIQYK